MFIEIQNTFDETMFINIEYVSRIFKTKDKSKWIIKFEEDHIIGISDDECKRVVEYLKDNNKIIH